MMRHTDFAIFILTHGRPDKVLTVRTLRRQGYTGRIVILLDNEDDTEPEYRRLFGDQVEVFDRKEVAKHIDPFDNFNNLKSILYARRGAFDVAERLGIRYFTQFDDDYTAFNHRMNGDGSYGTSRIKDMDAVLDAMLDYYEAIPALSIAMAQGGDFIGGAQNPHRKIPARKCMNSFICSTDRRFGFYGTLNDDVTSYTLNGSRGGLFLTIKHVSLTQVTSQKTDGGMTEAYKDQGTYVKSFYSVIGHPSSVKVSVMGETHRRIHHEVRWRNTTPYIIPESFRKARGPRASSRSEK